MAACPIDQTKNVAFEICWGRGDTDAKVFTVTDDASPAVAIDVSTWTFTLTVNTVKDPDPAPPLGVEQFTIVGVFVTDGTDGKVSFTPAPGDTDIAPAKYFYDIERQISAAAIKTLVKGVAKIIQDISK